MKKLLVFSLLLSIIPLFTACNQQTSQNTDDLKARFDSAYSKFASAFENGKIKLHGVASCGTTPSIPQVLAQTYNANPNLANQPKPQYRNYDGSKCDKYFTDDGFVAIDEDFFIAINNDGYNPQNIQLYIDTNGEKGPNRLGYDLFGFNILPGDKLEPMDNSVVALNNPRYFELIK